MCIGLLLPNLSSILTTSFYFIQTFFGKKETIQPPQKPIEKEEFAQKKDIKENFYVLENEYQQIVFSDIGGSIVEINLPLKTKNNKSIVNPIGIDREILKDSPQNDYFPQKPYCHCLQLKQFVGCIFYLRIESIFSLVSLQKNFFYNTPSVGLFL